MRKTVKPIISRIFLIIINSQFLSCSSDLTKNERVDVIGFKVKDIVPAGESKTRYTSGQIKRITKKGETLLHDWKELVSQNRVKEMTCNRCWSLPQGGQKCYKTSLDNARQNQISSMLTRATLKDVDCPVFDITTSSEFYFLNDGQPRKAWLRNPELLLVSESTTYEFIFGKEGKNLLTYVYSEPLNPLSRTLNVSYFFDSPAYNEKLNMLKDVCIAPGEPENPDAK